MTEEAAPDIRAELAARGWPPIAGGAPEEDEQKPEQDTPTTPGPSGSGDDAGTPAPEPSEEGSQQPEEGSPSEPDWRQRYEDLQPEFTRASQEAAQLRRIIDLARDGDPDALEYLGYEAPEQEGDDELTVEERLEQRLQQHEEKLQNLDLEREQYERAQAVHEFYEGELEKLDPESEWPDEYRALVVRVSDDHLDQEGVPDLSAAHEAIQAQFEADFKKRVQSKRAPQAPSGAAPSQNIDLDEAAQRREWMAQRLVADEPAA